MTQTASSEKRLGGRSGDGVLRKYGGAIDTDNRPNRFKDQRESISAILRFEREEQRKSNSPPAAGNYT